MGRSQAMAVMAGLAVMAATVALREPQGFAQCSKSCPPEKRDPSTGCCPAPPPPPPAKPPSPPPAAQSRPAAPPPDPASWVRVNPGTFEMGSPASELGHDSDETQHTVTLTRAFWLKMTEVTQGEWQGLMGSNPSHFTACGSSCPVEKVSWFEVVSYCNALSKKEGLERCYVAAGKEYDASSAAAEQTPSWPKGLACLGYRLPSEAEWEYAARAGTATAFYTGDITETECKLDANLDKAGWYCGNAGRTTHPVKQKVANAWGLYDMLGNVWEWVWDWHWHGDYGTGPKRDPLGPGTGSYRVFRGGSWYYAARWCRAANRNNVAPGFHRVLARRAEVRRPVTAFSLAHDACGTTSFAVQR